MKLFDTSLLPGEAEFIMDKAGQPVPYFCEELHRLALDRALRQNDFVVVNPYERYSLCCGSVERLQSESCNAIRRLLAQLLQWQGCGT